MAAAANKPMTKRDWNVAAKLMKSTFPLKGSNYFLGCDGALQDDGTFTVRILLSGVRNASDARKVAQWLHGLISRQMPKTFKTEKVARPKAEKAKK